jgi:hypothetical protein
VAAQRLRRQLARLESTRRLDAGRGRLVDFQAEAAADDAGELARQLARGEGRLFRTGLYLTIRADDQASLEEQTQTVQALLGSQLLDSHPATFRSLHGWTTTLPLGIDSLRLRRTLDTQALAAAFPFASPELPTADGVLYGRNTASQGLVLWDRFTRENYNAVILAKSGAGKSYHAKLEVLRCLYRGVEAAIIDPEREYQRLTDAVGGTYLRLGAPGVRLNPFDLPADGRTDTLARRALFLHTLIAVMLAAPLTPQESATLDRAILAAYQTRGINADPRTHTRPAPLLRDLAAALEADEDATGHDLAARLARFTTGSHRMLFDGPTTARPEGHLVVFSLRDLPDELAALGTLLTLDAIWRRVTDPARRCRRLVLVDAFWVDEQRCEELAGSAAEALADFHVVRLDPDRTEEADPDRPRRLADQLEGGGSIERGGGGGFGFARVVGDRHRRFPVAGRHQRQGLPPLIGVEHHHVRVSQLLQRTRFVGSCCHRSIRVDLQRAHPGDVADDHGADPETLAGVQQRCQPAAEDRGWGGGDQEQQRERFAGVVLAELVDRAGICVVEQAGAVERFDLHSA